MSNVERNREIKEKAAQIIDQVAIRAKQQIEKAILCGAIDLDNLPSSDSAFIIATAALRSIEAEQKQPRLEKEIKNLNCFI